MKRLVDVVIPTFDNVNILSQCITSLNHSIQEPLARLVHFNIVNNGHSALDNYVQEGEHLSLLRPGKNLGWEGGLNYALERTSAPFVLFANDDIRAVEGDYDWLWRMLNLFNDPSVGAVGPSSNFVMGVQSIFHDSVHRLLFVKYLIGFCMLVRREALEKAGGVDESLPGGDDIDLSIRLRDKGYNLICRRDTFMFHHGAMTGNRVHRDYWNSPKQQEATNLAIIKKHGMFKFWETMVAGWSKAERFDVWPYTKEDAEGILCREYVLPGKVVELGCGGRKTVEGSLGVDILPRGLPVPFVSDDNMRSLADINADVSNNIPIETGSQDTVIARHILEHCQDPLGTMAEWNRLLRNGGRLIVAVPDPSLRNTIVMNPEHIISFTPESLSNMAMCCGFDIVAIHRDVNHISFVAVFEKVGAPNERIMPAQKTIHPLAAELVCA